MVEDQLLAGVELALREAGDLSTLVVEGLPVRESHIRGRGRGRGADNRGAPGQQPPGAPCITPNQ